MIIKTYHIITIDNTLNSNLSFPILKYTNMDRNGPKYTKLDWNIPKRPN